MSFTWIHCNICYNSPVNNKNKLRLWFTSCGHLFCSECLKAKRWSGGQPFECTVCHHSAQLVEVNRHLRPELVTLFRPLRELLEEHATKMKQTIAFQQSHRHRYNEYLLDKTQRAVKYAQSMKNEAEKLAMDRDKMRAEFEKKKRHLEGMLADANRELQRLAMKHGGYHRRPPPTSGATPATVADFSYSSHRHNSLYHHNHPPPTSATSFGAATPATLVDISYGRHRSRASFTERSMPFRMPPPPTVLASFSNTSIAASGSSRRSFSYLSPATSAYNRSMSSRSAPLVPGRITKAPILPPSFAIQHERDHTETVSFG